MEIYRVGERIKEERIRRNLSQEELSYGICSVVTLSRIENGMQKPSLKVEEALLEKLGCSTENLVFHASNEEVAKHRLETELIVHVMHRQPIGDKLEEYKKLMTVRGAGSNLEKQFVLMVEAVHASYAKEWELSAVYDQLESALRLTIPNYREQDIGAIKLLTNTEITIINNLALVLYKQNEILRAVKIMYFLVAYIEASDMNIDTTGKKYPMLVYNLAKMVERLEDFEGIIILCEKGIAFCKKYGRLATLPEFYYYKAVAYTELGKLKEALESYEYAICLYKLTDKMEIAKQIQGERDELLKCNHNKNQVQHDTSQQPE